MSAPVRSPSSSPAPRPPPRTPLRGTGGSASSRARLFPPPMLDPLARVEQFARDQRLFRRVDRLLVAVSGGPDSVAALLLLRDLRETFGYELLAAHFDHMLRPES